MYPGEFGNPAEDINCRCVALTRARAALDEDELKTLEDRARFFGLDKTESFADFKKKYLEAAESVDHTEKSGIIKLRLQLFAESDLRKQKTSSIKKGVVNFRKRIAEHQDKIANPQKYADGWKQMDARKQSGLLKHWEKEIENFRESVNNRVKELKRRDEYDE